MKDCDERKKDASTYGCTDEGRPISNRLLGIREQAESMRHEAKRSLNALLKIPEGYSSGLAERFVDCVISVAMLEIAAAQQESLAHRATSDNP